jgi:hypothetical protein
MNDSLQTQQSKFIASRFSIPAQNQREMLEYDWEIEDQDNEEEPLKLRFLSNEIVLGIYDGRKKINSMIPFGVDDVNYGVGMRVSLTNSGCRKCASPEVYHLQLQILQGKQRLKMEHWVECCCAREGTDKLEENTYYAVKFHESRLTEGKEKVTFAQHRKHVRGHIDNRK